MRSLSAITLLSSLACLAPAGHAAVTVHFEPASVHIAPGQAFDVAVRLNQNFDSGIAAFGMKLSFDPARVVPAAVPVTVVPALDHNFMGTGADWYIEDGFVSVIGLTADDGVAFEAYHGLPLATFHFHDLGAAEPYQISVLDFDDATQWLSPGFDELDALVSYGDPLTVSVPEPASAALIGGLIALSVLRRRSHVRFVSFLTRKRT